MGMKTDVLYPPHVATRRRAIGAMLAGAAAFCTAPQMVLASSGAMDLAMEGQGLLANGKVLQALPILERANALAPQDIWILGLLARGNLLAGRDAKALEAVNSILTLQPDEPTALMIRDQLSEKKAAGGKQQQFPQPEAPASSLALRRIVLDPGHGGFDPGAVREGLEEKEIVLDVARRTARVMEHMEPGVKLHLTRTDDYFVPLESRAVSANYFEADLFVSLHANAHEDPEAGGVETYRCAERPSSAYAAKVAARENAAPEKETAVQQRQFIDLEDIIFRFERGHAWKTGKLLAGAMQQELAKSLPLKDRGVHGANFAVLRKARMPAVLVEAGFVSNPMDAQMLASDQGRERLAKTLAGELSRLARQGVTQPGAKQQGVA